MGKNSKKKKIPSKEIKALKGHIYRREIQDTVWPLDKRDVVNVYQHWKVIKTQKSSNQLSGCTRWDKNSLMENVRQKERKRHFPHSKKSLRLWDNLSLRCSKSISNLKLCKLKSWNCCFVAAIKHHKDITKVLSSLFAMITGLRGYQF